MFINRFLVLLTLVFVLPSFATPVLGQTKRVVMSEPPVAPTPEWQAAAEENVAYGVKMETFEASDAAPWIRIYGSKDKWTKKKFLDNGKANYKGGEDYFFLSGTDVEGNVGIPLRVEFKAGGDDAHGFKLKSVDYFVKTDKDMDEVRSRVQDVNKRNKVLDKGIETFGVFSSEEKVRDTLVAQVVFKKGFHLATTERRHSDNVWYSKGGYAPAFELFKHSGGQELKIDVSRIFVAVDARSSSFPIKYNSGEDSTVSQEELRRAINSQMSQTSSSDSTTVGLKFENEAKNPLIGKMKTELSFSHTHTDSRSESNSSSNENQFGRKGSHTSSSGLEYQIDMGDVTFFEVTKTATVQLLGSIPKLTTISPQVNIVTHIRPTTFRTNLETGELCKLVFVSKSSGSFTQGQREYNYQLSTELKNDKAFLDIAEKAWGKGPNGFSTRTEINPSIKARFGKASK